MRLVAAVFLLCHSPDRPDLRTGLETLYGGDFAAATTYFAELAARDSTDPAPVVFRAAAGADFWLATALGYRARERHLHGHAFGAAKDAKAMRDSYARVLALDSTCVDCYLGLGVYHYGLARAGFIARLVVKLIGLGSGNADLGVSYLRRVAHEGDLARVEGTWALAVALAREAARQAEDRAMLLREARQYVQGLAERYPANPVFRRFLGEVAEPAS